MKGFIVKEYTPQPSNWRSAEPLHEYMKRMASSASKVSTLVHWCATCGITDRRKRLFRHSTVILKRWSPKPRRRRDWSGGIWCETSAAPSPMIGTKACGIWARVTKSARAPKV